MQTSGLVYQLVFFGLLFFLIRNGFDRARPACLRRLWHRFYVWTVPWAFVVVACGWLIREVGRQPWMVYGELTTADAVSAHSARTVLASLLVFGALFATLAVLDWWLIARLARHGPHDLVLGSDGTGRDEPEPGLVLVGRD